MRLKGRMAPALGYTVFTGHFPEESPFARRIMHLVYKAVSTGPVTATGAAGTVSVAVAAAFATGAVVSVLLASPCPLLQALTARAKLQAPVRQAAFKSVNPLISMVDKP